VSLAIHAGLHAGLGEFPQGPQARHVAVVNFLRLAVVHAFGKAGFVESPGACSIVGNNALEAVQKDMGGGGRLAFSKSRTQGVKEGGPLFPLKADGHVYGKDLDSGGGDTGSI